MGAFIAINGPKCSLDNKLVLWLQPLGFPDEFDILLIEATELPWQI